MNTNLEPRKRPRSPSYPSIPLGRAIERAESIYANEGKHLAPIVAVLKHWGYNAPGGRPLRQIAALKKFGLLREEGSRDDRKVKLTDLALDIVMPGSPGREASLQRAALNPGVHKELRTKYPDGLPSDQTVVYFLERERNFTRSAANELLKEYKATMKFAGLEDVSGDDDADDAGRDVPEDDGEDEDNQIQMPNEGSKIRSVDLPLTGTAWVTVTGEFPMSDSAWEQMLGMLEAMKPGLTRPNST